MMKLAKNNNKGAHCKTVPRHPFIFIYELLMELSVLQCLPRKRRIKDGTVKVHCDNFPPSNLTLGYSMMK